MQGWRGGATAAAEGCSLGFPAQRQAKQRVVPIKVHCIGALKRFGPRKKSPESCTPLGWSSLTHPHAVSESGSHGATERPPTSLQVFKSSPPVPAGALRQ